MKDVEQLVKQRDKLFNDQSHAIFERIEPVLNGIRGYLISADPSYEPGVFFWEDVSVFEELIMLVGIVKYTPGDSFILDGEMVEITADNQEYFNRILRIGIPLVVVNQYDSEAVYDFLSQLHSAISEEEAIAMDEAMHERHDEMIDTHPTLSQTTDDDFEFDMDDLSDAQREALMHHKKPEKIN